jgi:hypothetical protein
VRSHHTVSSRIGWRWPLAVLAIHACGWSTAARAQVPIPTVPKPEAADTVKVPLFREEPPISPAGALLRSMLLPGWGQSILNRRVTGAVFVFWEGVTLGMTIKSVMQKDYLESIDADQELIDAKKQEIQDWAVLLVFNHFLAGAEAFVSDLLWDFPQELSFEAVPVGGSIGIGASISLP